MFLVIIIPRTAEGDLKDYCPIITIQKIIPFRWFVIKTDKVHFVGNTGIMTELIRTYSFFENVEITKACISRQGGASYLKHSRKLPPQNQKTIQHEYHIS